MSSLSAEFRLILLPIIQCFGRECRGIHVASRRTEVAIEKIIASCDGSVHSALEALLLVNEHLEAELHQLYAAFSLAAHDDQGLKTRH
jgi:hypothetical protein